MNKAILCRPFPPELIKQRQGQGGKMLSYIETHSVISRLNEGCDAWSFEIVEHHVHDDEVVVVAKLTADIVVKMAFGGSRITRDRGKPISIADDLKAAGSDALKKAASLLGVGLELYGAPAANTTAVAQSVPVAPAPAAAPNAPADRLTGKQMTTIMSLARRQNIQRDALTGMLQERFEKTDVQHLSRREASSFLSELLGANGG